MPLTYDQERIEQELDALTDEYFEEKQYAEEEQPFYINHVGGTRNTGEIQLVKEDPGDFFPSLHYQMAIDQKVGLLSGAAQALQTDIPVDTALEEEDEEIAADEISLEDYM